LQLGVVLIAPSDRDKNIEKNGRAKSECTCNGGLPCPLNPPENKVTNVAALTRDNAALAKIQSGNCLTKKLSEGGCLVERWNEKCMRRR
jgi:hypothetical protein